MSALSDLENLQLRDISDGDVRDNPRWQALMGEAGVKAFLAEMAAKHLGDETKRFNPGQLRDPHTGEWIDTTPGGDGGKNPLDKLNLGKRIDLKPGEELLSSRRIRPGRDTESWDLMAAEVDTPSGRQVRLGIIHPDDSKYWTAGPDLKRSERIAELDAEIERLDGLDLDDDGSDRLDDLQTERSDLIEFDRGNLNRTAAIAPPDAARMRTDLEAGIEKAKVFSKATRKLAGEYDAIDGDASLTPQQREARLAEIQSRINAIGDDDQYFVTGSIPGGPEGDLHYRVEGTGDGEFAITMGIKPPTWDRGYEWGIGVEDDVARFEGADTRKLLGALQELESGDQPKSAHRPDTQGKHLPGRHNQQDHAGDGVPDFPLDQLDKRSASDITSWYGGLNATSWMKLSPAAQKSAVDLADSESIDNSNHHPAEVLNALQLGMPHVGLRLAKHMPPEVMFEQSTAAVNGWYGKLTERDYRGLGDRLSTVSSVAKRQAAKGNPLPQQKLDALRAQVKADPGKGLVGRTPAVDAALANVRPAAQIGTPASDAKPNDFNWIQPKRAEQIQDQLNQDSPWTRAQRTALSSYTDATYRQINGGLRNPENPGDEHDKVRYLQRAADIQAAMRPWPEHTRVYRGTSPGQFGLDLDPQDFEQLEQVVGREFVDDGFTSTSIERSESFDYPVKVEIRVPAGTPAAYVAKSSQVTTENELLLAAGTRYRVLSADVIDLDPVDDGEYDERPYSRYAEIVMQVIP